MLPPIRHFVSSCLVLCRFFHANRCSGPSPDVSDALTRFAAETHDGERLRADHGHGRREVQCASVGSRVERMSLRHGDSSEGTNQSAESAPASTCSSWGMVFIFVSRDRSHRSGDET